LFKTLVEIDEDGHDVALYSGSNNEKSTIVWNLIDNCAEDSHCPWSEIGMNHQTTKRSSIFSWESCNVSMQHLIQDMGSVHNHTCKRHTTSQLRF
jgi:hypothetical protein